ncbi:MAG: methyltransferase domain-containing protein [Dehalococcoidia bacterium]
MQTSDNNQIIINVTNRYTDLAVSSNDCCGEESNGYANNSPEYPKEELVTLIPTVTEVSAGCGNPLTISTIRPNETVVDFGSGGGIDCFLASKQTGPNGKVYGVDMTPAMINLANKNKEKLGIQNVEFIENQIDQTGIASESVDVILSNCVINLAPDKNKVFKEAFRILKNQGRLQICDIVLSGNLPDEAITDDNWCHCLSGALLKADYLESISDAGFTSVETISERVYQPDSEHEWMKSVYSISILATK